MLVSPSWEAVLWKDPKETRPSLVAQTVKNPPATWETWVRSLGWEDPLQEGGLHLSQQASSSQRPLGCSLAWAETMATPGQWTGLNLPNTASAPADERSGGQVARGLGVCREHHPAPTPSPPLPRGLRPPPVPILSPKSISSKQPALISAPQMTPQSACAPSQET